MKFSISLLSTLKALLIVLGLNGVLLIILFSLGYYFHILYSFTWFGYRVIVLPFSLFVFVFSLLSEVKRKKRNDDNSNENAEFKTRMEKFHDS